MILKSGLGRKHLSNARLWRGSSVSAGAHERSALHRELRTRFIAGCAGVHVVLMRASGRGRTERVPAANVRCCNALAAPGTRRTCLRRWFAVPELFDTTDYLGRPPTVAGKGTAATPLA